MPVRSSSEVCRRHQIAPGCTSGYRCQVTSPSSLSEKSVSPQKRPTLPHFLARIWGQCPTLTRKPGVNWEADYYSDRLLA